MEHEVLLGMDQTAISRFPAGYTIHAPNSPVDQQRELEEYLWDKDGCTFHRPLLPVACRLPRGMFSNARRYVITVL